MPDIVLPENPQSVDLSPLGHVVFDRVRKEIAKPGSVVCLGQCVDMVKMLTDEENPASVEEITMAILKDTFLTARVLTVANSAYYNRSGRTVSSVSQAIMILGLSQIRAIVFSVLVIEKLSDQNHANTIRNRTVLSAFCGSVSKGIAEQLKLKLGEAAFLAGAFSQFGKLLVYSFLHDLSDQYDRSMSELGANEFVVTEQIFGMRIETLGKRIGELLKLPAPLLAHMDPYEVFSESAGMDKNLRQITRASFEICKVAERASTADEITSKLSASDIFRFGSMAKLDVGRLFHGSLQMIEDLFASSSGAPLFKKLKDLSKDIAPEAPLLPVAPPEPTRILTADIFKKGAEHTSTLVGNMSTYRTVIMSVCDTLHKGFGATHTAIAVMNDARTGLVVEAALGPKASYIEKNFSVPMTHNIPKLTNVALFSGRDVYIEHPTTSKHIASIPLWILEISPQSFVLMPVISEKNRYGLIYMDGPALLSATQIPPETLALIQQLKNHMVWSLSQHGRG